MTDRHILYAMFAASAVAAIVVLLAPLAWPLEEAGCPHLPTRMFWFCFGVAGVGGAGAMAMLVDRIASR
jgi:hypothetical protein